MRWNLLALVAIGLVILLVSPSAALPTEIFIFATAAMGLNVLFGMAGLLSFGHAIFFGGAAYACGLILLAAQPSALLVTVAGGGVGFVIALIFSFISIRAKGIYFVMLTLILGVVGYFLVLTFKDYTGGENGLSGISRPNVTLFGTVVFDLQSPKAFLGFCAAVMATVFVTVELLSRSPLGSVLTAFRLNEQRTEVVGYNTRLFRLIAFCLSGFITGLAGAMYAMFLRFVPLNAMDIETSEKIVIMVLIGGVGSTLGPVVGAVVFLLLGDLLAPIWPRWMMIMGVLLILVVMVFKGGIVDLIQRAMRQFSARRARSVN